MPKVKFNVTRVVDDHRKGTKQEERYEAGKVYDLPEASAARWVGRGVAAYADESERKRGGKGGEVGDDKSGADGKDAAAQEAERRRQALQ